jgi:hypothetical protein
LIKKKKEEKKRQTYRKLDGRLEARHGGLIEIIQMPLCSIVIGPRGIEQLLSDIYVSIMDTHTISKLET